MDAQADRLKTALEAKAKSLGVPLYVLNEGSVMGLYFTTTKPRPGSELPNPDLVDRFHLACLNNGVQMGPGGMVSMATAITDKALEEAREGHERGAGRDRALGARPSRKAFLYLRRIRASGRNDSIPLFRHPGESRGPGASGKHPPCGPWIPAFAGMTA